MCTSIIEIARAEGMAKRGDEWFPLSRAVVAYDHARHAPLGDVIDGCGRRPDTLAIMNEERPPQLGGFLFWSLVGFSLGGDARLDDRNLVGANPFCGARRSAKILRADASIHASQMVGAGQHVGERDEHCGFQFGRQWRRLPHRANRAAKVQKTGSMRCYVPQAAVSIRSKEASTACGRSHSGQRSVDRCRKWQTLLQLWCRASCAAACQ